MTSPGSSCWPSDTGSGTWNGSVGGAALVRVSSRLPVFLMSKVFVTDFPTCTEPNCSVPGLIVSWALPLIELPEIGSVTSPVEDLTTSVVLYFPAAVGLNDTGTETESPAASLVPVLGRASPVLKGPAGAVAPVIVVVVAPLLVMLASSVTVPPTGTSPKSSVDGSESNPSLVPVPCRSKANVPVVVAKAMAPESESGVGGL